MDIPPTYICAPEAFVDKREYTLGPVPRSKDKAEQDKLFRQWQANGLAKYPSLLKAYGLLEECWRAYHPVAKSK